MQKSQEKTILILHGWGSFSEKWRKTAEFFEKNNFQVIAPDLPGFGKSPDPPKPWDVDDYVEWVKNFINEKKIENFFLLGHSFGGRIAIKFSAKYPEKVQKLILVSSAGVKPKKSFFHLTFLAPAKKLKWLFQLVVLKNFYPLIRSVFYKYILRKTDYLKVKKEMKGTFKKIIKEDLTHCLSQIKTSTLIVWGDKDKMTPISDGYLMNKKIPNSKLKVLKGVGHAPHLECPKKLSKIILKFIF